MPFVCQLRNCENFFHAKISCFTVFNRSSTRINSKGVPETYSTLASTGPVEKLSIPSDRVGI